MDGERLRHDLNVGHEELQRGAPLPDDSREWRPSTARRILASGERERGIAAWGDGGDRCTFKGGGGAIAQATGAIVQVRLAWPTSNQS